MTETQAAAPAPAPKPTAHRRSHRAVRWIRRHQRMLTFVGALIVFGTFIVKDALRDQLRELGDAIKSAEDVYLVRSDLNSVVRLLLDLRGRIDHLRGYSLQDAEEGTQDAVGQMMELDSLDAAWLINSEQLLHKLPMQVQEEDHAELESLKTKRKNIEAQFGDVMSAGSGKPQKTAAELSKLANDILRDSFDIGQRTSILSDKVLQRAREIEATTEHRYELATWASYILYAIGWGLGLAGRLVGVEAIGGGGD